MIYPKTMILTNFQMLSSFQPKFACGDVTKIDRIPKNSDRFLADQGYLNNHVICVGRHLPPPPPPGQWRIGNLATTGY